MKNTFPPVVLEALEGISEIQGEKTIVMDLRKLENAVCDYFIITEAQSTTQVSAISEAINKRIRKQCDDRPWHTEGVGQNQWILIDYINVVIHIFQTESRDFYDIESLWEGAQITTFKD